MDTALLLIEASYRSGCFATGSSSSSNLGEICSLDHLRLGLVYQWLIQSLEAVQGVSQGHLVKKLIPECDEADDPLCNHKFFSDASAPIDQQLALLRLQVSSLTS